MSSLRLNTDGPRSGDYTVKVAHGLAECVRVLNHHTMDADALPHPSTIHDVLGAVRTAASGLDQLLRQLDARLGAMDRTGNLVDASDDDRDAVALTRTWTHESREVANHLAYTLDRAFNASSSLYLRDGGEE
ncbi:hypothetical protein [Nonomuraea sp. NPDC050202]|uniref:hypothetical protein n=1 Tax=Nonomuraea sp. NPDC050202 TaxID=3155035 RepID=UPI0033D4A395